MSLTRPTDLITRQGTARIEALSDAVFAIALTLLILDVVAMAEDISKHESVFHQLGDEWPTICAFVIGFLTILLAWVNHHAIFGFITRTDSGLLWCNGVVLVLVAIVPMPTAFLSSTLDQPRRDEAIMLMGGIYLLLAVAFWNLWHYARRRGLLDPDHQPERFAGMGRYYAATIVWTAVALAVSFLSLTAAIVLWALLLAGVALPGEFAGLLARVGRR